MEGEWQTTTIGSLCDAGAVDLQTGPFGSQLHASDYLSDGVPVVPTEAIRDRRIDHGLLPKVSASKAEELSRHRLTMGDILFARRGVQATGHVGYVRAAEDGFLCGTGAIRLRINRDSDAIDPDFLSHVLADQSSVEWFKFHAIGATMPNLNEGIIRSFPLLLPPISEQRTIANILNALDDKIELNRRINETLEGIARALFKSWFVDFDPVRAKSEGRDPGLPTPVAELFPNSFEDSDVGDVPTGWEVTTLGQLVELAYGNPLKDEARKPGPVPVFGSNGQVGWHDISLVRGPGIIVGRKGNPGTVAWSQSDFFPIDTTFYVIPLRASVGVHFLFHALHRQGLASLSADSAVPGLNRNLAYMNLQVVPTEPVLEAFTKIVSPIRERMDRANQESRVLGSIRDVLLPRLLSGRLRIRSSAHGDRT